MRKLILIAAMIVVLAGIGLAEQVWVYLPTGTFGVPDVIENVSNPIYNEPFLYEHGYRKADDNIPAPAEGYERSAFAWIQNTNDETRAVAVYSDTLIADRIAREKAADLQENFTRYVYNDTFLMACDALSSSTNHVKMPMETVTMALLQVRQIDKTKYENLRDGLNMVNAALTRYDIKWWDTCSWNDNASVVSNATAMFGLMQ